MHTKSGNGEHISERIVELANVSFSYGSMLVVENVNLSVRDLDFLGIIGPNGGGKTTIIKLVLGLLNPDRGRITVFGERPEDGRRHIGYVPQQFEFDPDTDCEA